MTFLVFSVLPAPDSPLKDRVTVTSGVTTQVAPCLVFPGELSEAGRSPSSLPSGEGRN
jgi:hypothetical protein